MHFLSTVILTLAKEVHAPPSQNDKCVNHCCRVAAGQSHCRTTSILFCHYFVRCESEKQFLTFEHLCFILKHLCVIEKTSRLQKSPFFRSPRSANSFGVQ